MTAVPLPYAPPHAPSALERAIHAPDTPFTRWLVRWRWWFFAVLALLPIIQFNGQWRVGLDSSIYRGVADSLAAGHGYTFPVGHRQTLVYPGLPYLLAGLQKIFGQSLIPPLVLMNALAIVTLAGVYQLIKARYPLWIAVVVVCGVGMNARFLMQAQEIMTDMPFLCAVVWAMLAWEWLATDQSLRQRVGTSILLALSLFLAATMRPTFWVLAAAWGLTAAWNVVRHRERRSMIALGALLAVLLLFMAVDPRAHGIGLLQGAYERQLMVILPDLKQRLIANGPGLFNREIPEAFFGELMSRIAPIFSTLLLVGALIVTLRQPLWGLQILILTGVMLAISDVPRYYLMVLPALWLSYVLAILLLTAWAKPVVRDYALFALFSVANFQNLGGALRLTVEQHTKPFLNEYKRGGYLSTIEMAKVIGQKIGPDDVVIGPSAQILAYFSGRQVLNGRLLGFDAQKPGKYPDIVAAAVPKPPGKLYLVGPAPEYDKKDADLYKLLIRGVIVPGKLVTNVDLPKTADQPATHLWLAEASVKPFTGDWRNLPRVRPYPLAGNKRTAESAEAAKNRAIKQARQRKLIKTQRAERAAYLARKQRKLHKQQKATTQPTSLDWQPQDPLRFIGGGDDFPSADRLRSMPA